MPRMSPMLAGRAEAPFDAEGWIFEVKWDGYRCLSYISCRGIYLDSRNGRPLLPKFPSLASIREALRAEEALLDGEVVAFREGRADFSYLRSGASAVVLAVFDLLWLDGEPLLEIPLRERRERLRQVLAWGEGRPVFLSEAVEGRGQALYEWACGRGLEGVMAKKADSPYYPGKRSDNWLKIKNLREGRFWVVGYAPSPGRRIGSLMLAEREGATYRIVGRVASGLDGDLERRLLASLQPLDGPAPPANVEGLPSKAQARLLQWVKPFFGVEVSYTEMTSDGRLRHPVLREVLSPDAG